MLDARFDKVGRRRVLPLAQAGQTAAEHLICERPEHTPSAGAPFQTEAHTHAAPRPTFDVALVSDSLIGGPAYQELLELHPGFLLVG